MNMKPAVGMDLGTTYSSVAVYQKDSYGHVTTIPDKVTQSKVLPSVVCYYDDPYVTTNSEKEDKILVGHPAREELIYAPENTIFDTKRLIGKRFDEVDPDDLSSWPFEVVDIKGLPRITTVSKKKEHFHTPEEIAQLILTKLKITAEEYLKETVYDVVITVPAHFNKNQRKATQDAGQIAGLNVLALINEPTAAGFAYVLDCELKSKQNIVVFDFGGGTFDVTVLTVTDGKIKVAATDGDTHLGGSDIDHKMVDHVMGLILEKHAVDLRGDHLAKAILRKHCEEAKRRLSTSSYAKLRVVGLPNVREFTSVLYRTTFDEIGEEIFGKTIKPLENAMHDAELDPSDIDEIIMVGGSSYIPRIREMVRDFFDGKEPKHGIEPEEAIAKGAAIFAAKKLGYDLPRKLYLQDVTPLTLGFSAKGHEMVSVINRNTHVPVTKTSSACTSVDFQSSILFEIFEGERALTSNDLMCKLGEMVIDDIPKAPQGEVSFDVKYTIDDDGILNVSLAETSTNKKANLKILGTGNLTDAEMQQLMVNATKYREEDKKERERIKARHELTQYALGVRDRAEKVGNKITASKMKTEAKATLEWIENSMLSKAPSTKDFRQKRGELELKVDSFLAK